VRSTPTTSDRRSVEIGDIHEDRPRRAGEVWSYPGSGPRPTNDPPKVMLATLPSYPAMLDIEGVQGVEEISLIGSEAEVTDGLGRIAAAAAGPTDFTA
jgi:hypothetical protein